MIKCLGGVHSLYACDSHFLFVVLTIDQTRIAIYLKEDGTSNAEFADETPTMTSVRGHRPQYVLMGRGGPGASGWGHGPWLHLRGTSPSSSLLKNTSHA